MPLKLQFSSGNRNLILIKFLSKNSDKKENHWYKDNDGNSQHSLMISERSQQFIFPKQL